VPATIVLAISTKGINKKIDNQNWLKTCILEICIKISSIVYCFSVCKDTKKNEIFAFSQKKSLLIQKKVVSLRFEPG
jgi:hypothetical protein